MEGIYPLFIPPYDFLCNGLVGVWGSVGVRVLPDIFDARLFVSAFTAPRLRLVAVLRLQCRFSALVDNIVRLIRAICCIVVARLVFVSLFQSLDFYFATLNPAFR